jgi:glycosyltransferase involved in cell wall biosynthesis
MKILFDCPVPVLLAHGGAQIQIDQTKAGLAALGVEVEYLRWWDPAQRGDLIHFFGATSNAYLRLARAAGKPVVITNFFAEPCNRSDARLIRQGRLIRAALKIPVARQLKDQLMWTTFANAAHNLVGLACEQFVLEQAFSVPPEKISRVPLGLAETFLRAGAGSRAAAHLICTGTITQRKNSVELAGLAHAAQTPILFVGKPYHAADPYWLRFQKLVDGRWVKYQPHTDREAEMIQLLQTARGFVLLSQFENWCLSAHEAVACGLPLLVPDQKWSRERFGDQVRYFASPGHTAANVETLKKFYADAPGLAASKIKLYDWVEVAQALKKVYEKVLADGRL